MADDRVHFAGVERSSWPNNMEGALESGECAADEVLRSLVAAP
jgi:monoamine oxidase